MTQAPQQADFQRAVERFCIGCNEFLAVLKQLGLEAETTYILREYTKNYENEKIHKQVITPTFLLQNYDYSRVKSLKVSLNEIAYFSISSVLEDGTRMEETFDYRIKKPQGATNYEDNDYAFNKKSIGYVRTVPLIKEISWEMFEGYPNQRKYDFMRDTVFQYLLERFRSTGILKLRKTDNPQEIVTLDIQTPTDLYKFICKEGLATFITSRGKVLFLTRTTIHGKNRVNTKENLNGFYLSNL